MIPKLWQTVFHAADTVNNSIRLLLQCTFFKSCSTCFAWRQSTSEVFQKHSVCARSLFSKTGLPALLICSVQLDAASLKVVSSRSFRDAKQTAASGTWAPGGIQLQPCSTQTATRAALGGVSDNPLRFESTGTVRTYFGWHQPHEVLVHAVLKILFFTRNKTLHIKKLQIRNRGHRPLHFPTSGTLYSRVGKHPSSHSTPSWSLLWW